MTISSTARKAGPFDGNDATTSFPFTFKVFAKSDLQVLYTSSAGVETELTLDSHYSVTLNADQDTSPGGTVTYPISGDPLATNDTLTIVSAIPETQEANIANLGGFYPSVIEASLDRAIAIVQQLKERFTRTLSFPASDSVVNMELPTETQRANSLLGFDADGRPTAYIPADQSAASLAITLLSSSGAALVGSAAWYADVIVGFDATDVPDGATVVFSGRDTANDGGGGVFTYNSASTQTTDDILVFAPTGGGRLFRDGWTIVGFNGPINIRWAGAVGNGTTDDTAAIQSVLNAMPNPSSGYYGGGEIFVPKGKFLISEPLYYPKNNITLQGVNSLSSVIFASASFAGTEMLRIDPEDHASYVIFRNCNVRDIGFDHNNVAGIRSITANSLNDGCEFKDLRSWNFDGTVFRLGKSARSGAILSQGVKIDSWNAITSTDLVDDVFITDECNEILFINNKALGLSSGTSDKTGFHIGKSALSQGVTLLSNSTAHIVNGTGIRFNTAERCWAFFNTLENVVYDVVIGHDTDATKCIFVEARANRHYPTPTNPSTDIYINRATSCVGTVRENGVINITVNAVNCEAYLATNRTDGTSLPSTVTLASTSSVVHETHKNGTAIHHSNGSLSFTTGSSGVFDVKLPGGGYVRGDANRISVIAAAGKGARLIANSATVEATSSGGVTINSASGQQVAIQENGTNKILLDGSGRIRVFGLTTAVPGVSDALYKDASDFVKITP